MSKIELFSKKNINCFNKYFSIINRSVSDYFTLPLDVHDEEKIVGVLIEKMLIFANSKRYTDLGFCLEKQEEVKVNLGIKCNTKRNEKKTGWDIAIIFNIQTSGFQTKKFVLLQAKRLYPDTRELFSAKSTYKMISPKSIVQSENMFKYSKESYYLLLSPTKVLQLEEELGTRVITADQMISLTKKPPSVNQIVLISDRLEDFMIDMMKCKKGDTNKVRLRKVLNSDEIDFLFFINVGGKEREFDIKENGITTDDWLTTDFKKSQYLSHNGKTFVKKSFKVEESNKNPEAKIL